MASTLGMATVVIALPEIRSDPKRRPPFSSSVLHSSVGNRSLRLIWSPSKKAYKQAYLCLRRVHPRYMAGTPTQCMAPDEEKMTKRSPLDFPVEWDRPAPGRRPDIFPQFSPMKTPLPQPSPTDPPLEEEEEEEKKEEEEEPEKEPEKPEE